MRHPAAAVDFKKLESVGKLPTLKLVLKKDKGAGKSKSPFDNAKKVEWITPIASFYTFDSYSEYWKKDK